MAKMDEKFLFSRRSFILGAGQTILLTGLMGRLLYLGGVRSKHYKTLSNENSVKLQVLLPERGLIYDREQKILATSEITYRLVLRPQGIESIRSFLEDLERVVSFKDRTVDDILEEIKNHPRHLPFILRESLSWEELCRVEVQMATLKGVSIEKGHRRFYPEGERMAHVLGFVQIPHEKEGAPQEFLRLSDFRIGKEGIEKSFDEELRGHAGYQEVEVNARRRVVRYLSLQEPRRGNKMLLSLNKDLQCLLQESLAPHESASAVVMSAKTGEVLGLYSHPSFDPNLFVNGISKKDWTSLNQNPYGVLNNKAIKGLYAPGSLFKMIVALAALEAKKITKNTTFFCPGFLEVNGHRYHCYSRSGHGSVSVVDAISQSCDVFFYETSKLAGIDRIEAMAHRFGYGRPTGIELPGEKKGLIPGRSWKLLRSGHHWTVGDTILSSIGQGAMLSTPLQNACAMAALARGGVWVKPTLLKGGEAEIHAVGCSHENLSLIKQGMDQVVNDPRGTAYGKRITIPGWEMGGKTATSQVRRISKKERETFVKKNEDISWKERDHALFAGYAPLEDPEFVVSVVVEHGGGGGRVAAPLARDILLKTQKLFRGNL